MHFFPTREVQLRLAARLRRLAAIWGRLGTRLRRPFDELAPRRRGCLDSAQRYGAMTEHAWHAPAGLATLVRRAKETCR